MERRTMNERTHTTDPASQKHGGNGPYGVGPNRPRFGEPRAVEIAPESSKCDPEFRRFTVVTDETFWKGKRVRLGAGELLREGGRLMVVADSDRPYWMQEAIYLRDATEKERAVAEKAAAKAAEPPWPGQRFYDRKSGKELEALRNTDAPFPHEVGQTIGTSRRGRVAVWVVAAVEDDDDTVLLDREERPQRQVLARDSAERAEIDAPKATSETRRMKFHAEWTEEVPAEAAFTKGDGIERLGRKWVVYAVDLPSPSRGPILMRLRGYDVRVLLREPAEAGKAQ
jgi:hypothetical protein